MRFPSATGLAFALMGAFCFGVVTPLVQLAAAPLGTFTTSALLCAGAATFALFTTAFQGTDPPVQLWHAPRLLVVALLGSVCAPALLVYGLARTNGVEACLLMNCESVFTAALGLVILRERLGWRFVFGVSAITVGAMFLMGESAANSQSETIGLVAIAASTFAWALDNVLARQLAECDPAEVVFGKCTIGALVCAAIALATEPVPESRTALAAVFLCGVFGYGATERMYLLSQRYIGVARTSSVFGVAPFFGAVVALAIGAPIGFVWVGAGCLMAIGVMIHATESAPAPADDPLPEPELAVNPAAIDPEHRVAR
ncbi:MAG: DMT family transporter [Myxococcota bacterium]